MVVGVFFSYFTGMRGGQDVESLFCVWYTQRPLSGVCQKRLAPISPPEDGKFTCARTLLSGTAKEAIGSGSVGDQWNAARVSFCRAATQAVQSGQRPGHEVIGCRSGVSQ